MRQLILLIIIICLIAHPVSALEFTAPEVPESGEKYFPKDTESFSEGLWQIIKLAVTQLQPSLAEAAGVCFSLIAVVLMVSMLQGTTGISKRIVEIVGTLALSVLLVKPSNSLIQLGIKTVEELSEYGKLLLPVMTTAMAAQGGTATSAALYTGTTLFNGILTACISNLIVPMIYIFITLSVANSAIGEDILKNLRQLVKWLMTWCLKIIIYLFTGYIGVTGVVSGAADASAIKAAKLAISGVVPVVGSIISDASEAILVSAGVMKGAVGVYGLLAMLAVWIGPFLQIGIQYLLLKVTSAVCGIFGCKASVSLIRDFSDTLGFLLAMVGTVCLLLLISTVCFMKGVS